ncbi:histone-lysine N-methyltransferase SETD1B-A-like [Solea senegalensis]|uniref:Histone-lysine N-methyltransferase SETD1B-A-like n=1 Tax=Solea senegalensis TaxID=28829 RepID=A0AAV6QG50_SOLSE|nr:histone-lysine N-methyltransferase SETD1B-A-like [Solea senegalensis]
MCSVTVTSGLGDDTVNHSGVLRNVVPTKGETLVQLCFQALTNVMDSDRLSPERETPPHWKSCKLMIDPALTKGLYKVYRYDGHAFNIPVQDLGLFPVDCVRDPRISRLWSKSSKTELSVPKFKVDEWYVGPVLPKEVTFSRLNDNVKEPFLTNMCSKYGNTEEVEIFYNPKNRKHLGLAKVVFDSVRAARDAAQQLHQTSVMGNIIHVEIDPKGENRARYLQLLLRGLYTPWTLPVGSSEQDLQSLVDSLPGGKATQQQGSVCSPTSIATPLSMDTAYSSIWQDTPCSFRLTPRSQGTPLTPCLSATPLSQDSCYSSLQATPVLQGEPSNFTVHKHLRPELCRHKRSRYEHRAAGKVSDTKFLLKHCPAYVLSSQAHASGQQAALWGPGAPSSTDNNTEPTFDCQDSRDSIAAPSDAVPSFDFTAEQQQTPEDRVFCPSVINRSSSSRPEVESLDSRIENLLINSSRSAELSDGEVLSQPTSPCSAQNSPFSDDSLACSPTSCVPPTSDRVHVRLTPSDDEEDETSRAVSFLTRNSQSPTDFNTDDAKGFQSSSHPQENHATAEVEGHLGKRPTPSRDNSSLSHLGPRLPRAVTAGNSHPPVPSFPFPIPPFPPSLPPVPPRLPNGSIPIPPPGWIRPPAYLTGIPIPPPSNPPPPPAFLGPPPPLMVPPSVPPPVPTYHFSMSRPPPPWPAPPFPRFNPFVPPPPRPPPPPPPLHDPHKVTVEKVLEVVTDELKSIIKKDIVRRMIEGVSFRVFEEWWDGQEKKQQMQVPPVKNGVLEQTHKQIHLLGHMSKKPPLPSFKVKRKTASDPASLKDTDGALSSSDVKQAEDTAQPAPEGPKRRHARPHVLDSDDDGEGGGADDSGRGEVTTPGKVDAVVPDSCASPNLSHRDDGEDDDDEDDSIQTQIENEVAQKPREGDAAVASHVPDGSRGGALESVSECSSSGESEHSSDVRSSDSFSSDSFEDSSCSNLSLEDDDDEEDDGSCIVISSEDESMELEPPLHSSAAPLTPGALLDLCLQDVSHTFRRRQHDENRYPSCPHDTRHLQDLMDPQTSRLQDPQPASPLGFTVEPYLDVDLQSPQWTVASPEITESLRPLTPTGCLLDSDPDLLIKSKPTSPAVEEVERPQTPGRGTEAEPGSEDLCEAGEYPPLSPMSGELVHVPSEPPAASYHLYQEVPKTPGREERSGWSQFSSARAPATPGREAALSDVCSPLSSPPPVPSLCSNPYTTAPKTPGRDIVLPRRAAVYRRTARSVASSQVMLSDGGFPMNASSSPRSLSDSSLDAADVLITTRVRTEPLRGLENVLGVLHAENQSSFRRKQWRRLKRTLHRQKSLKRIAGPCRYRGRSRCRERTILHSVWTEGLDEEDARLLRCTYDRLQEHDNGFGWLNDTVWIPHPHILVTKVHYNRTL